MYFFLSGIFASKYSVKIRQYNRITGNGYVLILRRDRVMNHLSYILQYQYITF